MRKSDSPSIEVVLRPRTVTVVFATATGALLLAHLAGLFSRFVLGHGWVYGLVPQFDFNKEGNIPSIYSTIAILTCAALLLFIGAAARRSGAGYSRHWFGLAAVFVFLGFDEAAALHENLHEPLVKHLDLDGILFAGWVVPYALLLLVLAAIYWNFIFDLDRRTRNRFILAGAVYVTGVMFLEMLGASQMKTHGKDALFFLIMTAEEFFEMVGIVLFIHALTSHLAERHGQARLRIGPGSAAT